MQRTYQLGRLADGRAVTPESVSDDLLGDVLLALQSLQATPRGFLTTRLLQQDIKHLAVLVDRPP